MDSFDGDDCLNCWHKMRQHKGGYCRQVVGSNQLCICAEYMPMEEKK